MKANSFALVVSLLVISTAAQSSKPYVDFQPAAVTEHASRPVYYYPGLLPNRDARTHSPYRGNSPCEVNDDYLVRGGDAIQLILQKEGTPAPQLCPDEAAAIVPGDPTQTVSVKPRLTVNFAEGLSVVITQARPQLPISLLYSQQSEALVITSDMTSGEIYVPLSDINADERPTPWSRIRQIFERDARGRLEGYKLHVALRPRDLTRVMPGDVVDLYRTYKERQTPTIFLYGAQHYPLMVDASGFLWIPPLSTTTTSLSAVDLATNPRLRVLTAANDQQSYWVKAWDAGQPLDKQASLEEIATCLSQYCSLQDAATGVCFRPQRCLSLGIDERFKPGNVDTTEVRYQLLPGKRYWTLTDEQGRSYQQEYRPGQRLVEAMREAYRNATGAGLFAPGTAREYRVYLMVVGGLPFINSEREVRPEPPFYGEVYSRRASRLDDVLIQPRDRVFVLVNDPAKNF